VDGAPYHFGSGADLTPRSAPILPCEETTALNYDELLRMRAPLVSGLFSKWIGQPISWPRRVRSRVSQKNCDRKCANLDWGGSPRRRLDCQPCKGRGRRPYRDGAARLGFGGLGIIGEHFAKGQSLLPVCLHDCHV